MCHGKIKDRRRDPKIHRTSIQGQINQAIQEYGNLMGQQRSLMDKTMRQQQGEGIGEVVARVGEQPQTVGAEPCYGLDDDESDWSYRLVARHSPFPGLDAEETRWHV